MKKGSKKSKKKVVKRVMARRRGRVRTVYRKAARRYGKRASGIGGKFKPAIAGAICGAAPPFVEPLLYVVVSAI